MRTGLLSCAALAGALLSTPAGADAGDPRFDAMVRRPLFSPTRRPPPPAPPPVPFAPLAPAAPPPLSLSLSGVIAGGGGGVALLRRPQDEAAVRVTLGGQIDGWTLAEVHPRSVVLRRESRSVTVDLQSGAR